MKPYGSKIHSHNNKGWVYALEASPTLWSAALRVSKRYNFDVHTNF